MALHALSATSTPEIVTCESCDDLLHDGLEKALRKVVRAMLHTGALAVSHSF